MFTDLFAYVVIYTHLQLCLHVDSSIYAFIELSVKNLKSQYTVANMMKI